MDPKPYAANQIQMLGSLLQADPARLVATLQRCSKKENPPFLTTPTALAEILNLSDIVLHAIPDPAGMLFALLQEKYREAPAVRVNWADLPTLFKDAFFNLDTTEDITRISHPLLGCPILPELTEQEVTRWVTYMLAHFDANKILGMVIHQNQMLNPTPDTILRGIPTQTRQLHYEFIAEHLTRFQEWEENTSEKSDRPKMYENALKKLATERILQQRQNHQDTHALN